MFFHFFNNRKQRVINFFWMAIFFGTILEVKCDLESRLYWWPNGIESASSSSPCILDIGREMKFGIVEFNAATPRCSKMVQLVVYQSKHVFWIDLRTYLVVSDQTYPIWNLRFSYSDRYARWNHPTLMFDKPTKNAEGKDKRRTGHCQDQYLLACWNEMVEFCIPQNSDTFGDQKMMFWKR